MKRFLFWALLALGTSSNLNTNSFAAIRFDPIYVAHGVLTQRIIRQARTDEQHWFFNLAEDAQGLWKMELNTKLINQEFLIRTTEIISYDGTNIYSVVYSPDRLEFVGGKPKMVSGASDQHPARICSGPFPIDHSSAVGVIWLAFIGGWHLDKQSHTAKFPDLTITDARKDPIAWSCDLEYKLRTGPGRSLIEKGQFFLNRDYLKVSPRLYMEIDEPESVDQLTQAVDRLKAHREMTNFSRSTYEAQEVVFTNGIAIPREFKAVIALPLELRDKKTQVIMVGRITNVARGTMSSLLPELKGIITVDDRRLRFKGPKNWRRSVTYQLDGGRGWLLNTNDSIIKATVLRGSPLSYVDDSLLAKHQTKFYRVTVGLFSVVLLGPLLVYFWRRYRRNRTE